MAAPIARWPTGRPVGQPAVNRWLTLQIETFVWRRAGRWRKAVSLLQTGAACEMREEEEIILREATMLR